MPVPQKSAAYYDRQTTHGAAGGMGVSADQIAQGQHWAWREQTASLTSAPRGHWAPSRFCRPSTSPRGIANVAPIGVT